MDDSIREFYQLVSYGNHLKLVKKNAKVLDKIHIIANTLKACHIMSQDNIDPKHRIKYKTMLKVRQEVGNLIDKNSKDKLIERMNQEEHDILTAKHNAVWDFLKDDLLEAVRISKSK